MLFVALARPELLDRPADLGRWAARVHGLPLDPLSEAASQELAEQLLAPRRSRTARQPWSRWQRETRCSSRSSPASIAETVDRRTSCRPASARSSRRGSTRFRSTSGASSWTHRSPGGCSGVVRSRRWRGHDDLATSLSSLEDRGLIGREAVSRIKGDQQFAFKHALIQDVAYQTLPRAARRERHAAVARFLSATTATGQSHEALARHWREAGRAAARCRRAHGSGGARRARLGEGARVEAVRRGARTAPEDDATLRRAITMKRMATIQALIHVADVESAGS